MKNKTIFLKVDAFRRWSFTRSGLYDIVDSITCTPTKQSEKFNQRLHFSIPSRLNKTKKMDQYHQSEATDITFQFDPVEEGFFFLGTFDPLGKFRKTKNINF